MSLYEHTRRSYNALQLLEHEAARWLTKDELNSVKWLPADVEVLNALQLQI